MTTNVTEVRGASETEVKEGPVAEAFDSAFDEATKIEGNAELSPADDPANHKEEVVPKEEPPAEVPVVPAVTPPASEQQPGESDEKYEQRYKTLQGIHKHDRETWESERAALLAQIETAKTAPVVEPPPDTKKTESAQAFKDSLTDEQKQQLEEYEQDFDVVSKMEGLKREREMAKLRAEIAEWKTDIASQLTAQSASIAPAVKFAEESEAESHFSSIRNGYDLADGTHVAGHVDFEKYRDDGSVKAWIESKPRYLQPALNQAYSQGSAADVIDLFNDFKRDTNIITPKPSDNVVQMTPASSARKQALTSVTTRRGAVNTGSAVAADYDSAFDEALNK